MTFNFLLHAKISEISPILHGEKNPWISRKQKALTTQIVLDFVMEINKKFALLHRFWYSTKMPTVIALDVSLSMRRVVPNAYGSQTEPLTRHNLAVLGINTLLNYLQANCKLEFVSLVNKLLLSLLPRYFFTKECNVSDYIFLAVRSRLPLYQGPREYKIKATKYRGIWQNLHRNGAAWD